MISFEMPESIRKTRVLMETVAENMMRPVARYFDENEHQIPWDYINFMHQAMAQMGGGGLATQEGEKKKEGKEDEESEAFDSRTNSRYLEKN